MTIPILIKAKSQMVLSEPFYATILLNLAVVETKEINGRPLAVAATDGKNMYINPESFGKLTLQEAKGVLKHEVMHIAQLHLWRGVGKEPTRWNHACDYAINPIILEEGGSLPQGVLDGSKFAGMTAEQIYKLLPPSPPQDKSGKGQGQGQGGSGPAGNPLDDDIMAPAESGQAGEAAAQGMVAQAAAVAKAQGKLPGSLKEMLDKVLRPKIDWKEQLRQFLTELVPDDYSFARPNRRFISGDNPQYFPSIYGSPAMRSIGYLNDTSGSITMKEMQQGLGEIGGAVEDVRPGKLIVAHCDAKVQHHEIFDHPSQATVTEKLERHGNGGTDMMAGLKWFARKHPDVQCVVVFTDGEFSYHEDESSFPFPVIWAITNSRHTAPWGTTVHVEIE